MSEEAVSQETEMVELLTSDRPNKAKSHVPEKTEKNTRPVFLKGAGGLRVRLTFSSADIFFFFITFEPRVE